MMHRTEVTKETCVIPEGKPWRVRGYEWGTQLVYQDFFAAEEEARRDAAAWLARF